MVSLKFFQKCARFVGRSLVGLSAFGLFCILLNSGLWYFDSAVYWVPALSVLAGIAALCCLAGRSTLWGFAALACLVAYLLLMTPVLHSANGGSPSNSEPNLRILTTNVYDKNHDPAALLKLIRDTDPDVVVLQEVNEEWQNLLAPLESEYPQHACSPRYPRGGTDLAQYWRIPSEALAELAESGIPATSTEIKVDGISVRVVNVHTAAPFSPHRAARYRDQMEALTKWLKESGEPVIVAGDFNSSVWSPLYRKLVHEAGLVSAREGRGLLGTWPSFFGPLRSPIDHILVSPGIEVVACRVGPGIGSDHRPLIADLRISKRQ